MSYGAAIRAGAAFVELYTKNGRLLSGLANASRRLRSFGVGCQAVGRQMLMVGAMLAVPFALATKTYAGFTDQMAVVRAVSSATQAEFEKLTDRAKELGRTTSYTASQVAEGMTSLGRAGFKTGQILDAIGPSLNVARATATDLGEATEIAAGTLRAFGGAANEMGRYTDVLTATANNSAQTLTDLGESMKYAAPLARIAGESVESLSVALGVLANMQVKGSMAGTALKNVFAKLADKGTQAELRKLGIEAVDAADNLRPIGEIMAEIGQKAATMGSGAQLALANTLFGKRGMAPGLILGGAGEMVADLEKAIYSAAGTAAKTSKTMDATIGGTFRIMMSAIEGVAIAIGGAIAPALDRVGQTVTAVAGTITELIGKNKAFVVGALKAVAVIIGMGTALMALGMAVQVVSFAIAGLTAAIRLLGTVTIAMKFLAAIPGILSAVFSPLGLVIAGVALLGFSLVYFTGLGAKALDWLADRFQALKGFALGAFRGIADALAAGDLAGAANILWVSIKLAWTTGVTYLKGLWIAAKNYCVDTWGQAAGAVRDAFATAWQSLEPILRPILDWARDAWDKLTAAMVAGWNWLRETITKYGLAGLLVESWAVLRSAWWELVGGFYKAWAWACDKITAGWKVAEETLAQGIGNLIAKWEGLDPAAVAEAIDDQYRAEDTARDKAYKAEIAAIDAETNAKQSAIEKEKAATLAKIEAEKAYTDAEREKRTAAEIAASRTALDQAQAEWEAALAAAAKGREETELAGKKRDLQKAYDELMEGLTAGDGTGGAAAPGTAAALAGKFTSAGTFNPYAVAGMSGGGVEERIAKATERVADSNDEIARRARQGRLVFQA